jgi:hypothetical protein
MVRSLHQRPQMGGRFDGTQITQMLRNADFYWHADDADAFGNADLRGFFCLNLKFYLVIFIKRLNNIVVKILLNMRCKASASSACQSLYQRKSRFLLREPTFS